MNQIEREYSYKPKWSVILLCGGFFALGAVVMGYAASTNDRGLILNGILDLSMKDATRFYWGICAVCGAFVALAALLAIGRLWVSHRIAFTDQCIIVPKSRWTSDELAIDFRDITQLATAVIHGQRFLYIHHPGGKQTIVASMLPTTEEFDEICRLLAARIGRPL